MTFWKRTFLTTFALSAALLFSAEIVHADIVYSNVTTFLGSGYSPGGAVAGASPITRLVMDDIDPINVPAANVTAFSFTLVNLNAGSVSFRPRVRFWRADGAGAGPGTYLATPGAIGYTFNPVTMGGLSATTFSASVGPGFVLPFTKTWAGVTFDNNSNAAGLATVAELNLLGVGLMNPPTIGTSADQMFVTTGPGSFFNISNPAGAFLTFGGSPVANSGWAFTTSVPEPSSYAMLGLLGVGVAFVVVRRKRS